MPARKKLLTSSVSRKGISTEVVAIFLFLACCILAPGCHPCALVGWGCDLAANPLYYPQSRLNSSKSLSLSSVLAGQRYPQSNDQTGATIQTVKSMLEIWCLMFVKIDLVILSVV